MSQYKVPPGAWDAHMHVTDLDKFPSEKGGKANYKAHSSTIEQALANGKRLSISNLAFTQVSTYGLDNSCLLWCLEQTTPEHGRGVVAIDPHTIQLETLQQWHKAGVRGVRVNLKSVGAEPSPSDLRTLLSFIDKAIQPLQTWAIHIYADMSYMGVLRDICKDLSSKICIDHFGSPAKELIGPQTLETESWKDLKQLLQRDGTFVKISAPYRFFEASEWLKLEVLVKDLLSIRGGKACIFASDWPHTRFEDTDIKPWVDLCLDWCGDNERLRYDLFRGNAERLYDV